ncbi:DoxX family protein [Acidisoma cellulosilyticum]|nr:DoxX family protein [Acidisoma cellulosilyticum]
MQNSGNHQFRDEVVLVARLMLVLLFLIFGWSKMTNFAGTVSYMAQTGMPLPFLGAVVAIIIEFFVSIAVLLGIFTQPLAVLMALYTLATGFIGHKYWLMTGVARYENEINFFKNVSIAGGFLLLYVTGPGRYALPIGKRS